MKMPSASGASIDVRSRLEDAILQCDDLSTLAELLAIQATVAAPSAKLDLRLRKLVEDPLPHLTAAVLRVYRFADSDNSSLQEAAAAYLTISCYDGEWYDETINSIGWANELLVEGKQPPLVTAYKQLLQEAEEQNHDELLNFCRGYSR